ncbi:hypothetical protein CCUS01_04825 [Colletotrichum cuscutae]|uniref:Uncharacterized protein n=1 Tax=Colletotrichum cuscutae TaxID=1209917 RepID=A0AAI9Y3L2_9PEZI|nr:hypothetical protein CCUS01_04825 [Colletotrichum cuscutae]
MSALCDGTVTPLPLLMSSHFCSSHLIRSVIFSPTTH